MKWVCVHETKSFRSICNAKENPPNITAHTDKESCDKLQEPANITTAQIIRPECINIY